jgi:hypothetical protein
MNQQMGQIAQAEQGRIAQGQQFQRNMRTEKDRLANENRLGQLDQSLKTELLDKQMQFQRDDAGRVLLNQRQLLDFAALQARDMESLKDYQQAAQQASDRVLQMMEFMHKRLTQEMQLEHDQREQSLDIQHKKDVLKMQQDLEDAYLLQKAHNANITGAFTAIGTVVGAAFGGSVGAGAGGAIGGAVGGAFTQ